MRTILYDKESAKFIGNPREGRYLIDGLNPVLPVNIVELEIIINSAPDFDLSTQKLEWTERVDLENGQLIREEIVVNLTQNELLERAQSCDDDGPEIVTTRQFRLALIERGIMFNDIDAAINNIQNEILKSQIRVELEYSYEVNRKSSKIIEFAKELNLSAVDLNNMFKTAINL